MNINELIKRSHTSFEADPNNLTCINSNDPLVIVNQSTQLVIDPIWEESEGHFEGLLYKNYITKHPKYCHMYLRNDVAARLYQAARNLPKHLSLVVKASHRPLSVQTQEIDLLIQKGIGELGMHPDEALHFARTYVDDPALKIPSHCSGAAVDVELFDTQSGSVLDFGSIMNTESEQSFLHANGITPAQKTNRSILLTAMLQAGFAPTYVEWWHYSYGDRVWAYFYKKPQFLYGIIEPEL